MQHTSLRPSSHRLIESDRVEGTTVYGAVGQRVGTIKRLAIEKTSGQVAYAVMSSGGFFGLAAETHTVPRGKLKYDASLGGYRTDITESELRDAPDFFRGTSSDWPDRERERELHDYYGVRHYWIV
jgi:hypothetical protein